MKKLWIARGVTLLMALFALWMTIFTAGNIVLKRQYEDHWNQVEQGLEERSKDLLAQEETVKAEWLALLDALGKNP